MPSISAPPEGVFSLLDTDLYKLTMQCAVLKYFPTVEVEYAFSNRTPQLRLNREAFEWLEQQVVKLEHVSVSVKELAWLRKHCIYLSEDYLSYLQSFRLRPKDQVKLALTNLDGEFGDLDVHVAGLWVETILYEIPLLALTSQAYFKFVDRDWTHEDQEERAYQKGNRLLQAGCAFSEFGSRRRRDFETQDSVVHGLARAAKEMSTHSSGTANNPTGKFAGTSNVYFAMKYGVTPIGTVAHEWFMGIAAITNDYENANEIALRHWMNCFGRGVLGIALTDTFGSPAFLKSFQQPVTRRRLSSASLNASKEAGPQPTFAEVFPGLRQDSGDPKAFVQLMSQWYETTGHKKGTIVFSDSLNVERCLEYKLVAEKHGFTPSFGIGTFFTNDFDRQSEPGTTSKPLNIVIKISSAGGRPAIKISDNMGKNTGDSELINEVKGRLGYTEQGWEGVSEAQRW